MTYEEWTANMIAIRNAVACPKCHAAAGDECVWGSTHTANMNHAPRSAKFRKVTAIASIEAKNAK